jgi:hypothetical protein
VLRRYFAPPGPILALSTVNMQGSGNRVYPHTLQVENIGDKAALEIAWEVRDYYHPDVPPPFERVTGNRVVPLKPLHHFLLDVDKDASDPAVPGHDGLSTAHFSHYEILIWYRGPNRVKYLSWFSLALGDVTRHREGLNPAQRAFSFVRLRIWTWHCWHSVGIQMKVRLRPYVYRLLKKSSGGADPPGKR